MILTVGEYKVPVDDEHFIDFLIAHNEQKPTGNIIVEIENDYYHMINTTVKDNDAEISTPECK